ncbi:MAG: hypothetical protein KGZ83_05210 [Sulfuricella sp.]|nr:hypothetical protein [Sulfuricella sp.]
MKQHSESTNSVPACAANGRTPDRRSGRKQIALSLGETLPAAVMDYLMGVCPRMSADLTVLCGNTDSAARLLAPYCDSLQAGGIAVNILALSDNPVPAVARYLNANRQVLFVVSSGNGDPLHNQMLSGGPRSKSATPPVPIVVVSQEAAPADHQTLPAQAAA